ncbi:MAG TPA: hypothetical protein VNY74_09135 [Edaphobacter sp.]|nr:hypothetical protein [Edaphobacter sp.]
MEFNGKNVAVLAISSVIVGALLGNWFGSRPRGKHIRLEIEHGTNRVVLVPQKDDIIHWYTQPTSSHPSTEAYVRFQQWSPCQEGLGSTPTCTVNDEGYFEYKCDSPVCRDPGVDPRTTLLVTPPPAGKGKIVPAAATPTGPEPLSVPIGCDANQNPTPNEDPLQVVPTQVISWSAGKITNFTITIPAGFCQENPSSTSITADPNAICTVQATAGTKVKYNVNGVCTNSSGDFNINVN